MTGVRTGQFATPRSGPATRLSPGTDGPVRRGCACKVSSTRSTALAARLATDAVARREVVSPGKSRGFFDEPDFGDGVAAAVAAQAFLAVPGESQVAVAGGFGGDVE